MGRPKAVRFETFHQYDKLHTTKTKMMSGVEQTTLYPIKETEHSYISPEVWAYCASKFIGKKKNVTLEVNIPIIEDVKTIEFLKEHSWSDWVDKEVNSENSQMIETVQLLRNLYPNKEVVFFYELESLIGLYIQGSLVSYDEHGNIESMTDFKKDRLSLYNNKYNYETIITSSNPDITKAYEKYKAVPQDDKENKTIAYREYSDLCKAYNWEHNNLIDVFTEIGKNSVCYPVAFSKGTAEWYKEKYGKPCDYGHAGEILFVVTPNTIYFETNRHH